MRNSQLPSFEKWPPRTVGNFFLSLLLAGAALLASGCKEQAKSSDGKLKVVVTVGMIGDAVEFIGGERVQVNALMGPGIDPHLYKAREGDVSLMLQADIIFYNGLHLEAKLGDVLSKLSGRRVKTAALAEYIDKSLLLGLSREVPDPHVWMDPNLWSLAVKGIAPVLIEKDPAGREYFIKNEAAYLARLKELDLYVKKRIATLPPNKRVLITAHDAFQYFARAYGLKVKAIQGISTRTEASAADIRDIADFIARHEIPAIFVESSVPRKTVGALKEAVLSRGFKVTIGGELFSDAMGSKGKPEGTYPGMIMHNVNTIVKGLGSAPFRPGE